MQFLYWLESHRTPLLDTFFSTITHLGSETLFLAIAITVFWCVSKKRGYYLLTVGFFGTVVNQLLKLTFRVPRPWVKDPCFTIVEAAREEATGYSFPSGHTQNAVSVLGSPARFTKNNILRGVLIVLILLTGLSRMYLGVHTPTDVGVSLVIGTVLVFAVYPFFEKADEKPAFIYAIMAALAAAALAFVLFTELHAWPSDIDAHNLSSGIKNGYLVFGCSCAMLLSCYIEQKYINFDVKAPWWAQILKVAAGLVLVLALKAGLKPVLNLLFGGHISATALRYFLVVVFAACVWPLTFPWFARGCPLSFRARKVLLGIVIALLVLALLLAALLWIVTKDSTQEPLDSVNASNSLITPLGTTMLSGHRAGGGVAPENTMMALKNCVENPQYELDIFEFDIHLTADGVPVLLHDSTLDRTSDAVEYFGHENVDVGTKKFSELKKLNMGEHFTSDNGEAPFAGLRGENIPEELRIISLEEALEYLEVNGEYNYIIEIKNSGDRGCEAADKLYQTLTSFGCLDRTVVGTFHNEITEYIDSKYSDMPRSAGVSECIKFYAYAMLGLKAEDDTFDFVALQIPTTDYVINLGTSRVINYAHKNNIAVQYWTINDTAEMKRLQDIGADAIMTDVPDKAAGVLVQP